MNTTPSGDAMTVRFHRDADAGRLKREKIRRPRAWRIHPGDVAKFAGRGEHCHIRRCPEQAVSVTWRGWRSAEFGRVLLAEHFVCETHGQDFARRHKIAIVRALAP